ncbi:MAG: hypothetical protein KDB61_09050, partial [Planctomycetes bacterium]|nr:hypothetical protein [Planctomycetota bacterium]
MDLPLRYAIEPGTERVLSVDGASQGPGLNLSHWPGNETPVELKHELSTGIALNFVRLPETQQAELAKGCTALTNNHFDTDGVLALFVLRYPEKALPFADTLLEIAAAGDFFQLPSEHAFCFDRLITVYGDRELSPLKEQVQGLEPGARYTAITEHLFTRLPDWLAHGIDAESACFEADLTRLREDLAGIDRGEIVPLVHLDLSVVNAAPDGAPEPGRHALFHRADSDRILWMQRSTEGVRARFVIGTRSWFEIPGLTIQPRPDLESLAARLNELEGVTAHAESA